jgi:hypothetical protein
MEDKSDNLKSNFYREVESVFDKLHMKLMKIRLGDFNANFGKEDIFKLTIQSISLHEIRNENGFKVVNMAISKNIKQTNSVAFSPRANYTD